MPVSRPSSPPASASRNAGAFSESAAWKEIGAGWRPLHGGFRQLGYSIEWHDFTPASDLNWSRSFHPRGVEICLNLAGSGTVRACGTELQFLPLTAGFYLQSDMRLTGVRAGGERHQFVTVELSFDFLRQHLGTGRSGLHPHLHRLQTRRPAPAVSEPTWLASDHQQMIHSLRQPPVPAEAQGLWSQAKALEVAAALFFPTSAPAELFCQRQKRQNHERVQKVLAILSGDPAHAWTLEEIGRRVGSSQFYLSRIFTQEMGKSIFQVLREIRMKRAAAYLREGRLNVTEVALEVGYASPSHFSTAFHEAFGCCPGLYPLATATQSLGVGKNQKVA